MGAEGVARRRYKRYRPDDLEGHLDARIPARVVDISVSGLAVETGSQLRIGRTYRFALGDDQETIGLKGQVQWSRLRGTRRTSEGDSMAVYHSGIALDDMLSDTARGLVRLVERTASLAPGERLFARLRPPRETDLSVQASVGVVVRKISRRGMLVECEVLPDTTAPCEIVLKLGQHEFRSRIRIAYTELHRGEQPERRHHLGMELVDVAPEHREALDRYIRTQLERRGVSRGSAGGERPSAAAGSTPAVARPSRDEEEPATTLRGNVRGTVVHRPGCVHYGAAGVLAEFDTLEDAVAAGYRPCRICNPE